MADTMSPIMLENGDDPSKVTDESFNKAYRPDQEGGRLRPDPPLHRQRLRRRPREGEHRRGRLLVGRRGHRPEVEQGPALEHARRRAATSGPTTCSSRWRADVATASDYMNFVYDPKIAAMISSATVHLPVKGVQGGGHEARSGVGVEPADLPGRRDPLERRPVRLGGAQQPDLHRAMAEAARRMSPA